MFVELTKVLYNGEDKPVSVVSSQIEQVEERRDFKGDIVSILTMQSGREITVQEGRNEVEEKVQKMQTDLASSMVPDIDEQE